MFVKLTHTKSKENAYIRADKIIAIRPKEGKTLIIVTGLGGMYVDEDAELVRDTVDNIVRVMCQQKYGGTQE